MEKPTKYDEEELEILQVWEAGELRPVDDMAAQGQVHRAAAEAVFKTMQQPSSLAETSCPRTQIAA